MKLTVFNCLVITFIATAWANTDTENVQLVHDSELSKKIAHHYRTKPKSEKFAGWKKVKPHSRPFQVGLEINWEDEYVKFCGGALISPSFVLTAAHCLVILRVKIAPSKIQYIEVILGAHNIRKLEPTQVRVYTTEFIIHNEWSEPFENDIALVKLPQPVTFNKYIASVSLPSKADVNKTFKGYKATASGWGEDQELGIILNPPVLRFMTSTILSQAKCSLSFPYEISSSELCISAKKKNSCGGNSGGPLTIRKESGEILVGVVSFGGIFCSSEYPHVYTRVTSYLDWIQENIEIYT